MLVIDLVRVVRARLREWSGDDAYDRYVEHHRGHGHRLPTRREFYRDYFQRRGNRPRCC